jgi:hypothetical protein
MSNRDTIEDISNKIYDIFSHATGSRCRNLFIRFDVKFPNDGEEYNESSLFSEFMRVLIQDLNRNGYGDAYYLSVREKDEAFHGHYHVFVLLNGKYTQSIYGHMERARELWARELNRVGPYRGDGSGLIHYRSPAGGNGVMLRTDDPDYHAKVQNCIDQSLYLAKSETKDAFGPRGRTWGSTKGIPSRYG